MFIVKTLLLGHLRVTHDNVEKLNAITLLFVNVG